MLIADRAPPSIPIFLHYWRECTPVWWFYFQLTFITCWWRCRLSQGKSYFWSWLQINHRVSRHHNSFSKSYYVMAASLVIRLCNTVGVLVEKLVISSVVIFFLYDFQAESITMFKCNDHKAPTMPRPLMIKQFILSLYFSFLFQIGVVLII